MGVDDLLDDDQTETYTFFVNAGRSKQLSESCEQRWHLICGDPDSRVFYDDAENAFWPLSVDHLEFDVARLSELDCVPHEVDKHLLDPPFVSHEKRYIWQPFRGRWKVFHFHLLNSGPQNDVLLLRLGAKHHHDQLHDARDIE